MQHLLRGTDLEHPRRLFLTWQVEVADLGACVQLHCYSASSSVKRKSEMKLDCSSNFFFSLGGVVLGYPSNTSIQVLYFSFMFDLLF